jgi:hypothetical protein
MNRRLQHHEDAQAAVLARMDATRDRTPHRRARVASACIRTSIRKVPRHRHRPNGVANSNAALIAALLVGSMSSDQDDYLSPRYGQP